MSSLHYLTLELGTVLLYGLTLRHAARRSPQRVLEVLTATVFGLTLEWGDILAFGTYSYSTAFFLRIGPVPIIIGLCWAMIIYGAMHYSDQLGLPGWAAPFADAIWAIILDLAFDALAIRLHLWTWHISLTEGFFGVPAGNFHAWLYVALGFSAWTRFVRSRPRQQRLLQLAAPGIAYGLLVAAILAFDLLVALLYPTDGPNGQGMLIFFVTLAIFGAIAAYGGWRRRIRPHGPVDLLTTITRLGMHGYFDAWLLAWLIWPTLRLPGVDVPATLVVVALTMLVVEGLLLLPLLNHRRNPVMPRAVVLSSAPSSKPTTGGDRRR